MQVKAQIENRYTQTEIHVCSDALNQSVKRLVEDISQYVNDSMTGTDARGEQVMVQLRDVIRFYAEDKHVMMQDGDGSYRIPQKLYELEESLKETRFFRISKSEIVNLRKIKRLDMNTAGTIRVILSDGTETYTSRRNVTRLKKALGLG